MQYIITLNILFLTQSNERIIRTVDFKINAESSFVAKILGRHWKITKSIVVDSKEIETSYKIKCIHNIRVGNVVQQIEIEDIVKAPNKSEAVNIIRNYRTFLLSIDVV